MDNLKDDIEKYLQGKLTPQQMHLLEKKALGDPFLADALEGGASLSQLDFAADVEKLNTLLKERVEPDKKVLWWQLPARIAAGIMVLAVTGYVIYNLIQKENNASPLALNKPEVSQESESGPSGGMRIMDSISPSPLAQAEQQATKRSPAVQNEKPSVSTREREVPAYSTSPTTPITETPSSNEEIVEETVVADAFKLEEPKSNDQPAVSPISPKRDEAEKKAEMPRAQRKKAYNADEDLSQGETYAKETTCSTRIITGTVKDSEDGSVMPGVSVMVKGTNARTITNAEGNYKLLLDDDPKGELVFSFIGMQSLEIPIERDSINAMLSPDYATLSEVVVVGYSVSDAHAIQEKENTYKSADPVGGRKAYKNYMIQNVKYPQQALDNKIQGKVTVQFTVESSGLLNDFKVLKGIGYGCDEEVIRLVKDGPKWTAPSRNDVPVKGKVKVRLKFALPK